MAPGSEEDLTCPVCHNIFKDPVLLSCSHSFCKVCVETWWREKQTQECLVCNAVSERKSPLCNLALKNLCEAFLLERDQRRSAESEALCRLHFEKLKLFCLEHQQPVCLVCRDSKIHTGHRFRPITEAVQDHREVLQKSLQPLQERLKLFEQEKGNWDMTAEYINVQAQHTEQQIKEQFKKLHQFLQEEEEARITALKEEEEKKSLSMKEKIETLRREMSALSETVRATEEELRAGDVSFLQNYKAALKRVEQRLLLAHPEMVSGALIDVAKHLGNLTFNVWNKIKKKVFYSPVILDPNTAEPHLILSEDLTSVRYRQRQKLPDNPERFEQYPIILGSEGFNSGTHNWEVEVEGNQHWVVGVEAESLQRKGKQEIKSGILAIAYSNGQYTTYTSQHVSVNLRLNNLKRIRVELDWNGGKLSFYETDTNKLIYTFKQTFKEKVFPFLFTWHQVPLKILQKACDVSKNTN